MRIELPGRHDFDLHGLVGRTVPLLADGPGIHVLRHMTERRNLADLVEILRPGPQARNWLETQRLVTSHSSGYPPPPHSRHLFGLLLHCGNCLAHSSRDCNKFATAPLARKSAAKAPRLRPKSSPFRLAPPVGQGAIAKAKRPAQRVQSTIASRSLERPGARGPTFAPPAPERGAPGARFHCRCGDQGMVARSATSMLRCMPSQAIEQDHERKVIQARQALAVPHLCGPFDGADTNGLYRTNLAKGQTGLSVAFDLPTQTGYDSDHPLARGEVGKVGVPISHLGDMRSLFEGIPLDRDEHLDDHQRDGRLAARALCRARRRAGRRSGQAHRHDAERHPEGVSLARHLCLPARAVAAADHRHDRLYRARTAEMESDQCLLLSFAGGGRDAGAGACLRARDGHRRAR